MIASKRSPVWTFQPNDPTYMDVNRNYFDRGAYARPWPRVATLSGYVTASGSGLVVTAIDCATRTAIGGTTSGFTSLGGGVFRWWVLVPRTQVDPFFIKVANDNGAAIEKIVYQGTLPVNSTTDIAVEKGIVVRLAENAIIKRVSIPVNITSCASPVLFKVYSVDPHNNKTRTLILSGSTGAIVGLVGAQTLSIALENPRVWNPGDLFMVTIQSQGGDVIGVNFRFSIDAPDMNGWYFDATGGGTFSPYVGFTDWVLYAYDALISELLVNTDDYLTMIKTTNIRRFDLVPANTEVVTWVQANFWEPSFPQEMEDIEILPGEFTRLRNEQHRKRKLEIEYQPGFRHEHVQTLLSVDSIVINGTRLIMRDPYEFSFPNRRFGLAKATVLLTEQPTIMRNVI